MTGRLFDVRPAALGRIPLLPVLAGHSGNSTGPLLREAVFVASRQVETGGQGACAVGSRAPATIRAYELRARWRTTPNGAFAGAALAEIGGRKAVLRLGDGHLSCTVPSGMWLATVAHHLAGDPRVLDHVTLTTSELAVRRGNRFEIERPAAGECGPQRASVNATAAAELILRACARGTDAGSVVALVREEWPAVAEETVREALVVLARHGLVLTDLLPDDLWDDPLGHLLGRLPARHPEREALERLRSALAGADRHRPGDPARLAGLRVAQQEADQICLQQRPLSVNVTADACLELPRSVADAAADAATVLWRIGDREDPLAAYHRRFEERYGRWRLVPFTELCDPVLGLGPAPEPRDEDRPHRPGRELALARLIARAAVTGTLAVVLDRADITALAHDPGLPPPRSAEIWVRVLAATQADREAGRFFLAVSGCSQAAGSTAGRFAGVRSLLPADSAGDDTLVAELVIQARTPQAAPLAPPAGLARCRIPVGVVPRDGDLRLADLQVFSDGDRLIVWSARHGKAVVPVLYSRLSPAMLPPQARLLQLLGRSGCRPFQGWSWGTMRFHPFQPRIVYRQVVLSPARWLLPPDLTAAARERARWPQAIRAWQAQAVPSLPDIVVIEDGDRLLPLDLREDDDRELLRRYVGRGARSVTERLGGPDAVQAVLPGPDGDHVLELVLSLDRRTPAPTPQLPAFPRPASSGLYLPGSQWLSLALRAPAHLQDQLAVSLGEAVESLPLEIGRWFWLRYTDSAGPHLRARFHGDPAALGGQVLPLLSAWCRRAIQEHLCGGFSIDPYDQEIERYGGSEAITAAEDVFAADSRLALTILRAEADPGQRMITAAHCAATTALGVVAADPSEAIGRPRLDRAARHRYDLLRPQARAAWPAFPAAAPVTAAAGPAWHAWCESLTTYRDRLDDARRASCASSVIHMSANRLLGNLADETIARALAADLLGRAAHPRARA